MLAAVHLVPAAELDADLRSGIDLLVETHRTDAPRLLRPDWDRHRVARVYAVIDARQEPIGLAAWSGLPEAAKPAVWIRPDRRRNGIGRRTVELLAEEMRRAGVQRLRHDATLEVPATDPAVCAAATRLLRRLHALFEPEASGVQKHDWQEALAELRQRYPKVTTSTLFCVHKLQGEPSLRTPSFRDEAAAHGIKVSGRALHVARQLLGICTGISLSTRGSSRSPTGPPDVDFEVLDA